MAKRKRKRRNNNIIYVRFILVIILLLITIGLIRGTIARYRSKGSSDANVDLAYYLLKSEDISQELKLDSILPREQPYMYTLSVANYDGNERTQTALEYDIEIKTTTNLPLQYQIYKSGEQNPQSIISTETTADSYGTYFKYTTFAGDEFGFSENQQNNYQIKVIFPEQYNSAEYEGIIEYVEITVKSRQKIE